MLLRRAVGAELAAVPLAAVLRAVDESPRAGGCSAGAEAAEPVGLDDLDQRRRSGGAEVRGDRTLSRPESNAPPVRALLEPRHGAGVRCDLVEHVSRLAHVLGLEDAPEAPAEALDVVEVAPRRPFSGIVTTDDPEEVAQILELHEVLGGVVVGVPGVHERDCEVRAGLLRVPNDDQLTNSRFVSLKLALDPYQASGRTKGCATRFTSCYSPYSHSSSRRRRPAPRRRASRSTSTVRARFRPALCAASTSSSTRKVIKRRRRLRTPTGASTASRSTCPAGRRPTPTRPRGSRSAPCSPAR